MHMGDKMKTDIRIGDRIRWKIFHTDGSHTYKDGTVLEIRVGFYGGMGYRVTHPDMLFPKTGMWVYENQIIPLFQERDIK